VAAIRLTPDNRAEVTMGINREVRLHQNDTVTVGTGALLGERYVEVLPAPQHRQGDIIPPNSLLRGQTKPQLEDLIIASQSLVTNLEQTVLALGRIINDPELLASLRVTLRNFRRVSDQSTQLVATLNSIAAENRTSLRVMAANLAASSREVNALVTELSRGLREAGLPENAGAIAASIRSSTERIDDIVAQLQALAREPDLRENVLATVENVKAASDRLAVIANNLEQASQHIEGASAQAREASESANRFLQRVTGGRGPGGRLPTLPRVGAQVDLQYLPEGSRWWTEANLDLILGRRFLRTGVADIGESDRFNLQLGALQGRSRLRFGVVQSKAGLGLDWPVGSSLWSLDLFDPNDPRANLIGAWPLADGYQVTAGVRDALQDPRAAVGVRVSR